MENRRCSPSPKAVGTRPQAKRNRSTSVPIVEALGCSTPEAELILAEGRAAVRSRHASRQRRGRRHRSEDDEVPTLRPQDHLKYLTGSHQQAADSDDSASIDSSTIRHSRVLSDASVSTVTGSAAPVGNEPQIRRSLSSPLGNYSANLAHFIQSQLASIPSYHPMVYPRSCPDLTTQARSPPQSPTKPEHRLPFGPTRVIEMPPIRPPLRSAFSAWSSADDDTEDELPPLPTADHSKNVSKTNNYTPSILRYYGASSDGSFLLSSTPSDDAKRLSHPNVDSFSFPGPSPPPASTTETRPSPKDDLSCPSSSLSMHPQLTSSSAPSISSTSTSSYFDYKRSTSIAPQVRDRIIAAVSPHPSKGKILTATSPFEGGALANVHDILVESQHRVLVDGLSFDLIRDFNMPRDDFQAAHRVPTPC
ncbi:hypothetical protein K491DRAFT_675624 [Lophiostoma macrostomum CBS 122681]|uniref:Uncharacterized protein n=1 Tax=Lophiostoma macrostomum CBS 122681 TaxID=1314788 RepID=A0A6A6TKD1_9PLEO|nr:hypothetical protein K491DRAFT_675624 [Lophiostoma macrostomum CBS 122681]